MNFKIGITGGIGSGKTVVAEIISLLGIPVYIADMASKELTVSDPGIRKDLIELLGEEVYSGRELNKSLLANYLFSSSDSVKTINSIIHPRVREDFRRWAHQCENGIVAIESAILIEAGFKNEVDVVVMVYAPLEVRVERGMKRDNLSREAVMDRINRQMDDERKKEQADFVIINDGERALLPQVSNMIEEIKVKYLSHL